MPAITEPVVHARTGSARASVRQLAIAVAMIALGLVAFAAGRNSTGVTVLHGSAHVGASVMTVKVGNTYYGARGSVHWFDADGASHDSGWPDCLSAPGTNIPIRFGEVSVTAPSGDGWQEVLWIDCRG